MEPFEVYRLYLALKLHFTTKKYNITKTKGAVTAKKETFLKRKDLTAIRKLARDYKRREIIDLLVANFVSGDKWGGVFDTESSDVYKAWKTRHLKLDYIFEQDVEKIKLEMEKENISNPFEATEGYHPLVFRLYFGHLISIETLVVLDKIYNYANMDSDDIFLQDISMLVKKYRPFVQITDKMRHVSENLYK
tara:strand:- start:1552 stop:2127 length:576 start_codon:yes stop_codon:yes gene_type:complete